MVTLEQVQDGRTKRVIVTRGVVGWDVREEHDSRVVRQTTYQDWHRVERAMQAFELQGAAAGHSTKR
ncbi:MAG: hypothetical protein ABI634_03820 [Acidobacteriota bacterium]